MRFWIYWIYWFCEFIDFVRFLDFVGILYKHVRFFQFHQIALLRDHQKLACTSKDPPWRVDMKDMSLIFLYKNIYWVIDKTVWKPTLVDPFENRKCALIFYLNELYQLNVYLPSYYINTRPELFNVTIWTCGQFQCGQFQCEQAPPMVP